MTLLPTLDPEIADLGVAIGLLIPGPGGVELESKWFEGPAKRLAGTLADDTRRGALVRFGEAVLAAGAHDEQDGVTLLPLFNLRQLAGDDSLPDLTIQASLDARPPDHTEIGIAATLVTTNPATTTELRVPLEDALDARAVAKKREEPPHRHARARDVGTPAEHVQIVVEDRQFEAR